MEFPQNIENRTTIQSSYCPSGYFSKEKENEIHEPLCPLQHIYNSQEMEETEVSIDC